MLTEISVHNVSNEILYSLWEEEIKHVFNISN